LLEGEDNKTGLSANTYSMNSKVGPIINFYILSLPYLLFILRMENLIAFSIFDKNGNYKFGSFKLFTNSG
jgi:hypothetical protein